MMTRLTSSHRPLVTRAALLVVLTLVGGCANIKDYIPTIPALSFRWLYDTKKPGPLPELKTSVTPVVGFNIAVGKGVPGFAPAVLPDAIYAAAPDGSVTRIDPVTGRTVWRVSAGKPLSAGVGADAKIIVVGTEKGEVLAFDPEGKPLWTARVPTEIIAPPRVADGVVAVFVGDGSVHALNANDGSKKWVVQRVIPALTVRNYAGGASARGGLFVGTAGGRLLAMDIITGIIGWEGIVANPKGATELERIADVTSLPLIDDRQVCAAAFQGRLACFEITRGTLNWSRDISSLYGLASDAMNVYVTDDRGAIHAFDRTNGASVWKQDLLAARKVGGPQRVGDYIGTVDVEGFLHLLSPINGAYVGRIATDGSTATSQPGVFAGSALWQSATGNLFSVSAK